MKPDSGYEALRRFRISRPNADYFLTMGTVERRAGLTLPALAPALSNEIREIEQAGYWTIRGAVIFIYWSPYMKSYHSVVSSPGSRQKPDPP